MDRIIERWKWTLLIMLTDYREKHPEDKRSLRMLAESLMEYFYSHGLINKNADGKYLLPKITGDDSPGYMEKRLRELQARQVPRGEIGHIHIYHDDWCDFLTGQRPCNCNPDIKIDAPEKN